MHRRAVGLLNCRHARSTTRRHMASRDGPSRLPQRGFTLLEVLVGLSLLGLLITGLVKGTQLGLAAFDQQSRQVERHADLDTVHRGLRQLIAQARPGSDW